MLVQRLPPRSRLWAWPACWRGCTDGHNAHMPIPTDGKAATPALSAPQKALRKLGLVRDIDLALHLPLRYEDETRIVKLAEAREGQVVQVEGTVVDSEVSFRPRRQLLVTLDDGSDTCTLRFFSFYPSHQKALAVGARVRVRGEVRGGFMGRTMMHPAFHAAGGELPDALTPVYPTSAQLPQAYLRKAVASGLRRADLSETVPPALLRELEVVVRNAEGPLFTLRDALAYLHHPGPDVSLHALEDRSHPAWQRLKAEELLAQQLSQLVAKRERDALRAPALHARPGGLHEQLLAALPFALTAAQRRVGEEIAGDLARPVPMHRLLQGDVGSGKTVVAALAAAQVVERWLAMRAHGADRNPGRTAFFQTHWLAGAAARPLGQTRGLAHRQPEKEAAHRDAGPDRQRRGRAGGRHPRRDPGPGAVPEPGAGHHRRTTPVRCGTAPGPPIHDGTGRKRKR